jgi:hypothetical protein
MAPETARTAPRETASGREFDAGSRDGSPLRRRLYSGRTQSSPAARSRAIHRRRHVFGRSASARPAATSEHNEICMVPASAHPARFAIHPIRYPATAALFAREGRTYASVTARAARGRALALLLGPPPFIIRPVGWGGGEGGVLGGVWSENGSSVTIGPR